MNAKMPIKYPQGQYPRGQYSRGQFRYETGPVFAARKKSTKAALLLGVAVSVVCVGATAEKTAATLIPPQPVQSSISKREAHTAVRKEAKVGMLTGAATGAVVGGPIGAAVGLFIGGVVGDGAGMTKEGQRRAGSLELQLA